MFVAVLISVIPQCTGAFRRVARYSRHMAAKVTNICSFDTSAMERRFTDITSRQMPFVVAQTLNGLADLSLKGVRAAMEVDFDNPTPFTLNSMYVERATKTKQVAVLQFKDQASRGTPASSYLLPEIQGGQRQTKPFERLERGLGVLPSGMVIVPGAGTRLNSYGNVSLNQLDKILSMATGAKFTKSKRKGKATDKPMDLFVGRPGGGKLPMGIYQRTEDGIKPLFIFVSSAKYRARLNLGQVVGGVTAASFQDVFDKAFTAAMATARQ